MKMTQVLSEAAKPTVGRKYQHIEDLVLSNGSHGAMHAVERLQHMGEEGGTIELKWDGMPVVYWGRDEQGNFSMIPKNAWAYLKSGKTETSSGAPTVMRSPKDVQSFILGTGSGDPKARQQFANQFASLWPYFEKISPKQGYFEGGLLFYPGNKPDGQSAMPVLNKETGTYDFQPNITTFHIPVDSELGKQIPKSKMMVAVTGYYPSMGSNDEQRYPDAEKLSVPGIIVQGTTYVQEPQEVDKQTLANLTAFIKKNSKLIDNYLQPKPGLSNPAGELYTYLNKHLRTEGLTRDFPEWAKANLSDKKAQTLLSDVKGMQATLGAVEGIMNVKEQLIATLSQSAHGGIKQTKPEGYAQAHPGKPFKYDIPGQFVKTISQQTWSPKESVVNEAQGQKSAVIGWGRGMGHTGHDALVTAVIHQAEQTGATPFFVVSRSFGKDDPIPPETKLAMYKKKFPKYTKMFSLPTADAPTINDVLTKLGSNGYTDVTLVVGEDQKEAFGYLINPDKSGIPPYQKSGLDSLRVISRQDTKAPGSDRSKPDYHEGPRATPMREVLLKPNDYRTAHPGYENVSDEEMQFDVWRKAMSASLNDQEVLDLMNTAKENLIIAHTRKPRVSKKLDTAPKGRKLKEFITRVRPLLKEANTEQKLKILKLIESISQEKNKINEDVANKINNVVVDFYKPVIDSVHKEKVDDYADKARELMHQTNDPSIREKLLDIFKKGKTNPYLQGGIITTVGALLAGGVLNSAQNMGLSPSQTNLALQGILNTVIPTLVSRINGKNWVDTIKYTLASAGVGVGIAGLTEKKSDIIARTAKDLENPPKIMQHRVKRDQEREEQLKYRDIAKRDDDDFYPGDTESQQLMRYVKQHYPNATTKQQAFIKFVQRALMHSQEEDKKQDQEIEDLTKDVDQIKQKLTKLPVNESIDYLEEK